MAAINEALQNITEGYDIPDYIKKASLIFAAGEADIPSEFFRMVKIWLTSDPNREFTYIPEDIFDVQTPLSSNDYWTIDFDEITQTRRFFIVPTNQTAFTIRYIKRPVTLAVDTDDSGLAVNFDDVVAYWSAHILLRNEENYNKADSMEKKARELCIMAIQSKRKQGGVKQGERLRSRFEKYPLLSGIRISGT